MKTVLFTASKSSVANALDAVRTEKTKMDNMNEHSLLFSIIIYLPLNLYAVSPEALSLLEKAILRSGGAIKVVSITITVTAEKNSEVKMP